MTYRIVAERENETVRMDRMSSLMAVAKARVWASEGWEVTIIVRDEDDLAQAESGRCCCFDVATDRCVTDERPPTGGLHFPGPEPGTPAGVVIEGRLVPEMRHALAIHNHGSRRDARHR